MQQGCQPRQLGLPSTQRATVRPASAPLGRATGFTAATSVGRIRPQTTTLVRIAGAEPNTGQVRRPVSAQSSSLSLARRLGKIGSAPSLHGK
eukprot:400154-Amphidinium_carterae.1